MTSVADIILNSGSRGLQTGEQLGSSFMKTYNDLMADRVNKQKMQQAAAEAPYRQQVLQAQAQQAPYKNKLLQAQANMAQEQADTMPQMIQAKLAAAQKAGSCFTAASNAITGEIKLYNKCTGRWVTEPGHESTLAPGQQPPPASQTMQPPMMPQSGQPQTAQTPGLEDAALGGAFDDVAGVSVTPSVLENATAKNTSPAFMDLMSGLRNRYTIPQDLVSIPGGGQQLTAGLTSTAASAYEQRQMAQKALEAIWPDINKNMSRYQPRGGRGWARFQDDMAEYRLPFTSPKRKAELREQLTDLYATINNQQELAALGYRGQVGTSPGHYDLEKQRNQMFGGLPLTVPFDFPSDLYEEGNKKMAALKSKITAGEGKALGEATNPALAKKKLAQEMPIKIPSFKTKEDGVKWYNSQTPEIQARIDSQVK